MNKTQKKKLCRDILNYYNLGDRVSKTHTDELIPILGNHPEWYKRIQPGLDYIKVDKTQYYNNRCFYLVRTDGSIIDISFNEAISPSKNIQKIKNVCRYTIEHKIKKFRNDNVVYGLTRCVISGEILYHDNTHIDHYDLTFDEMFKLWYSKYSESYIMERIVSRGIGDTFTDYNLVKDFIEFHDENCKLRAVTKKVNLSNLNKC